MGSYMMDGQKKYIVYKHQSPSGKIYIGDYISKKPEWRWRHKYLSELYAFYNECAAIYSKEGTCMNEHGCVLQPNGRKYWLYSGEAFYDSLELQLTTWQKYCDDNWLSYNCSDIWSPENKVKWMLDGCANAILRPNMSGILTDYQKMKMRKYEIPMSSCGSEVESLLYSQRPVIDNGEESDRTDLMFEKLDQAYFDVYNKKVPKSRRNIKSAKKHVVTRGDKIKAIKEKFPNCSFCEKLVNTDGDFELDSCKYCVTDDRYLPVQTGSGVFYKMDKINIVLLNDGKIQFYTQSFDSIPSTHIHVYGASESS